jgi:hypothetical protein
MDCFARYGLTAVLGLSLLAGCGKSGSSGGSVAGSGTALDSAPMAQAAHEFLDAVLKGDTQRASAKLTPQAMQRILSSGKQFSPPGLETATFKIGQVRAPSDSQAIVQCVLTDTSAGSAQSEEMCCLLRKVDNDWRVSGIAYGTAPDKPWTLSDFETGQNMAIPRQTMSGMAGGQAQPGVAANATVQTNPATQSVVPSAPVGVPAGPSNVNSPNPATAGLGMPAVGAPSASQPPSPYTAQEPQAFDHR